MVQTDFDVQEITDPGNRLVMPDIKTNWFSIVPGICTGPTYEPKIINYSNGTTWYLPWLIDIGSGDFVVHFDEPFKETI